jgi:hypothetical protein
MKNNLMEKEKYTEKTYPKTLPEAERGAFFTQNFVLTTMLLKLSGFYALATKKWAKHTSMQQVMKMIFHACESKIADACLKLKAESYQEMRSDLSSEELLAVGNILHELLISKNILDMEDALINEVRARRVDDEQPYATNG